jgi:DNA topoisomerase-1
MRDEHVDAAGSGVRFTFRGKSGVEHRVGVHDRRLVRLIKRCQEMPGESLFQYVDEDDQQRTVRSEDVNDYLRSITEQDITAKDFRTWAGTVMAWKVLNALRQSTPDAEPGTLVVEAVKQVALRLGNTPAVCRARYIHPAVVAAFLEGPLPAPVDSRRRARGGGALGLGPDERLVLALLRRRGARAGVGRVTISHGR